MKEINIIQLMTLIVIAFAFYLSIKAHIFIGRTARRRAQTPETVSRFQIRFIFEPRDLWVGFYFAPPEEEFIRTDTFAPPIYRLRYNAYLCLIPMLPIRFTWIRGDLARKQQRVLTHSH